MYIVVTVAVFEAGKYVLGSSSVLSKFLANRWVPKFYCNNQTVTL